MKTVIQDSNDGFVTVLCKLKGAMNINSFSWAIGYDKSKVVPVTVATPKTDAPNSKLITAAAITPYFEVVQAGKLAGYNLASYQIENTTSAATGNYLLIAYAKNTGATIAIDGNTQETMIKMTFRKIDKIDSNTFNYFHKTAAGTVVSKMIYSTTNVLQFATITGSAVFTRPELFTTEILPAGYSVTLNSSSAADLMNTGDTVYDAYMNAAGATKVTVKKSYLATDILATAMFAPDTKVATISGLADGKYLFTVSRNGYLIRNIGVTIAGADVNLGNKPLLGGDVYSDGIIDGSDSETLFSAIGFSYGDPGYVPDYDLNLDGIIDGSDTETLFVCIGLDVSVYMEVDVDYYN